MANKTNTRDIVRPSSSVSQRAVPISSARVDAPVGKAQYMDKTPVKADDNTTVKTTYYMTLSSFGPGGVAIMDKVFGKGASALENKLPQYFGYEDQAKALHYAQGLLDQGATIELTKEIVIKVKIV